MTERYGYAGKILIVNLDDRTSETIDTDPYIEWVGGHGMASKLFWDFCEDKTVEAVDPKNVLVFATTPFSGAVVPAASARCEFTGISPFSLPEWYNRSSMGGRLAGMMKEAGYDACVVRGKADAPVWINVVNDRWSSTTPPTSGASTPSSARSASGTRSRTARRRARGTSSRRLATAGAPRSGPPSSASGRPARTWRACRASCTTPAT